jgi:O-antigen ligase
MILLAAQFLAFSRGAWMNVVLAAILLVGLTFMLSPDPKMRTRIMILAIGGFVLSALLLAIMLSNPRISALFSERANVMNYYDVGETGRFGNQLRSIPMLLVRPNGFGPVQFRYYLGHDPHNVFLNAFASFGWLGGIAYLTMIVSTLVIGVKSILRRSPWQSYAIAIFSCFVAVAFQGVQIDTEHWRHFYWLLGAMWGLFAATYALTPQVPRDADTDDQQA